MAMQWTSLQVGDIGTNCYLIKDTVTGKGAIVDPGDQPERIRQAAAEFGMEPVAILLTHCHFDHIIAVNPLKAAYPGLKVYLHEGERGMRHPKGIEYPEVTDWYAEGDVVKVGELEVKVLHTPGHSKGSVTLLCERVLFTGDTMFKNDMGRTDLWGGSDAEIFASLIRLSELPGDYVVCPGHMDTSTMEAERKSNYCLHYALNHR